MYEHEAEETGRTGRAEIRWRYMRRRRPASGDRCLRRKPWRKAEMTIDCRWAQEVKGVSAVICHCRMNKSHPSLIFSSGAEGLWKCSGRYPLPDLRVIYSSKEMEPGSVMMSQTLLDTHQQTKRGRNEAQHIDPAVQGSEPASPVYRLPDQPPFVRQICLSIRRKYSTSMNYIVSVSWFLLGLSRVWIMFLNDRNCHLVCSSLSLSLWGISAWLSTASKARWEKAEQTLEWTRPKTTNTYRQQPIGLNQEF